MDKTGEIAAAVYRVFPGVTAAFYNVHTNNSFCQTVRGNCLEISHCREGRIECEFEDSFYYLSSGDLSIGISENGCIKNQTFHCGIITAFQFLLIFIMLRTASHAFYRMLM